MFFDTSADVIVADGLSRIHAVSVRNTRYTDVIRYVADGLCRIHAVSVRITRYNYKISLVFVTMVDLKRFAEASIITTSIPDTYLIDSLVDSLDCYCYMF